MGIGVNSTKQPGRQAHEALVHREGDAENIHKLDQEAMESARRAEQRLKNNEGTTPGTQIFTK